MSCQSAVGEPVLGPGHWASHDHTLAVVDEGPLHQLRMLDQYLRYVVRVFVGVRSEAECIEARILSDEIGRRMVKTDRQIGESVPVGRCLQILDDVELDTGPFEQRSDLAGCASATIEVKRDHGRQPTAGSVQQEADAPGSAPPWGELSRRD